MTELALLCVHPHPDDETIACGGTLARYVDEGAHVMVVTCTGGEEGENLAGIDLGDDDLVTHRRRELQDALAALGVNEHRYLGYRDSGMVGTPPNDNPDSFHRADLDEAAGRLATIIRELRPGVVVSDDENGSYGHPDHIKANRVTDRAVALAADPGWDAGAGGDDAGGPWRVPKRYVHTLSKTRVFAAHERLTGEGLASPFGDEPVTSADDLPFGTDASRITTTIDVTPWFARKRAALEAHRSQIGQESLFLNMPDDLAAELFGAEEYALAGAAPGSDHEDDLFAGLRS